jgi:UDP-N-acetyl-D-mannosaminuronic acid transferase (WecB/TagA/CpsF family)
MKNKINILGIKFINTNYKIIKSLIDKGGLLVLPSGPGLATINNDTKYYNSLKNADIALFDSGYLCLLLRILKGIKVKKFSGFKFFQKFILSLSKTGNQKLFLIDPSDEQSKINKEFLKSKNINKIDQYIAPIYKKNQIYDLRLVNIINKKKPKYIIINLGGGTQEVLGYYLKKNLKYKPSIICTGAAISYFTKQQAPLNKFFDNIFLGWFIRVLFDPIRFFPRYLSAFRLFFIVWNSKIK